MTTKYLLNNILSYWVFSILVKIFTKRNSSDNTLFINLGLLGDTVISSIFIANEENFTNPKNIFFLVKDEYKSLFTHYNGSINIIYLDFKKYRNNLFYRISFLKKLNKLNIGTAFNLSFERRAIEDEITLLSGAINKYGYKSIENKRAFENKFDSHFTSFRKRNFKNDFENYSHLIESLINKKAINQTKIFAEPSVNSNKTNLIIVINPNSSREIKNWGDENYRKLIKEILLEENIQIVLVGQKSIPIFKHKQLKNMLGKTELSQAINEINNCDLFIGNDSGLLHVAKALGIPNIGIIGGGSIGRIYPYITDCHYELLIYFSIDCVGCQWSCIKPEPFCLTNVTLKNVTERTFELINKIREK